MSTTVKFSGASVATFDSKEYLMLALTDYEQKQKARKFAAEMPEKTHTAEIKQHREKRSLDSNAYFWTLCGKLAAVLNIPTVEIYREYVENIGDNFDIVPVRDDAKDKWIKNWNEIGLGWICKELGTSKIEGYTNVICYAGSSTYDSKQMSCLIELAVQDCREQGIETLPPHKLEMLNEEWGRRGEQAN